MIKVVITGGGTLGHITPALAVASELKQRKCSLVFIGSSTGPERDYIEKAGYEFYAVAAGKLRRYFSLANFFDLFRVFFGFIQSVRLLLRLKPDVVFAKGGYVTVPVAYAAAFLEIPILAHESDAVMGLANRLVASRAKIICTGFPVSYYSDKMSGKLHYTGNPVRAMFKQKIDPKRIREKLGLAGRLPIVLFMGSSQGAHAINELVRSLIPHALERLQVIHLTGERDFPWLKQVKATLPQRLGKRYLAYGHVGKELPELLSVADLVISRSSANSLVELATLGKASVLIPLPSAASDHQRFNAKIFHDKGAAVVLEQSSLTSTKLLKIITKLLSDRQEREQLAKHIRIFRSPDAAAHIAELIVQSAKKTS